jgi:hypothetical protein
MAAQLGGGDLAARLNAVLANCWPEISARFASRQPLKAKSASRSLRTETPHLNIKCYYMIYIICCVVLLPLLPPPRPRALPTPNSQ